MPEDSFADSLQQFTVHIGPGIGSFSQSLADAEMELAVGNNMVQGPVIELYINRVVRTTGAHADEGRIGSSFISKFGSKYIISHGSGLWLKLKTVSRANIEIF